MVEALEYCETNSIDILLVSELSRLGRNAFEVLEVVKRLIDNKINLFMQKEQFTLLDENKQPSTFAPVMIATLSTCAQLERETSSSVLIVAERSILQKAVNLEEELGVSKQMNKRRRSIKKL